MMEHELTNVIIQVLSDSKKPMKFNDILADISAPKGDVLSVLKNLSTLEIIKKQPASENDKSAFLYSLKTEINAIDAVRAANQGIDLYSFGNVFKINTKQKKMALDLSAQVEKVKTITSNNKSPIIHKHKMLNNLAMDEISSHLVLIYEASNNYLYEYLTKQAEHDANLKDLMNLHEHAEQSLRSYLESHNKL